MRFNRLDLNLLVALDETFVCVVWTGGSLAKGGLSFERYLAAGHVVMQPPGDVKQGSFKAWFLERHGVSRRVAITTYSFAAMPGLVVGTNYVATVHARLAKRLAASWPIDIRPTPVPIAAMEQAVQWHKYRTQDAGLVWLRGLLKTAVGRMDAPSPGR
jgi:LysR family nod box-dependent transcriptional activator